MSFFSWFSSGKKERSIEDMYNDIGRFSNDDDMQNEQLLELAKYDRTYLQVWNLMKKGGNVDVVPNAYGEFGHDITNPVPVNGVVGEITYLSRLLTSSGEKVFFHRLGSINTIDVFEIVSQSGLEWDILYLDMYNTRKTRFVPKNYQFQRNKQSQPMTFLTRGIDAYIEDFPRSFYDILFYSYNPDPQTMLATKMIADPDGKKISYLQRPVWHLKLVQQCISRLSAQKAVKISGSQILTQLRSRR
ncbi:MAG: hypothetical protein IJG34_06250 [Synergistaceae bacterium]|nr:hypothetical protein [Synergistaceae bacterium]MBQ3449478.1 hypothetical protein [Synergistaceae bacterium]MBQ3693870.1 hypothetical protein [Synergistaceae bacterium]MBQ9628486.1 hypothetical protein [Synergistaceae bacterium]